MIRATPFALFACLSLTIVACGGDDESGSGGSTSTSATTSASSSDATSTSGTGGSGGMGQGGMGQGGENPNLINGCDPETAQDFTGDGVDIEFVSFYYDPPCVRAKLGDKIRLLGDFTAHPIQGGTVVGGVATPDANSPIYAQASDPFIVPFFQSPGTYPYYCTAHYGSGMMGVIFLDP